MQPNDADALPMNARLIAIKNFFGDKQLCLVIEKRFFLCDKNFEFFQKLIAASLTGNETQLVAKAKISFQNKTRAIATLKEYGVVIEKK